MGKFTSKSAIQVLLGKFNNILLYKQGPQQPWLNRLLKSSWEKNKMLNSKSVTKGKTGLFYEESKSL